MTDEGRLLAGRYRVGALLGRGGMSDVHIGTDSRLGRTVAIKLLKSSLAADPAFRTRFRQEAQAAARMAHPTIVRVFDAGEESVSEIGGHESQIPFIVMEYVDGRLLKDIIREGAVQPDEAVRIIVGVLTALEYSHRAGVVHRDIKPGNIMITKTGQVKVMDFGIARAISDSSTTVAQTTAILGTASYFSPEQAKGESVDARTDLYSTGVVLFEMLAGRPPFRGDSAVAVAYQHVSEAPVEPSSINSRVSPALDAVVLHSLAKDRFTRYQSAVEFRTDVELAGSGQIPEYHTSDDSSGGLFAAAPLAASGSELALKQLTEDETMVRTQRRPPVIWIWAGILSVIVIVLSVMIWAFSLTPSVDLPDNSRRVPSLTGFSYENAQNSLLDRDLAAIRAEEASATVPKDQVIRTDPPAGTIAQPTDLIEVYVSTGAQPVDVPDVTNLPLADAQTAVTDLGLTAGSVTRENSPTIAAGLVLRTDPVAATTEKTGVTVDFIVSSGLVALPDLEGQLLSAAIDMLAAADVQLFPIPTPDETCPQRDGSPVTQQSLAPGDVPQKSEVTLVYCTGPAAD
ncbi:Stk1 family PASTA domain-containing Ser/Thr kinase [Cryobacterium sp. TMT2-17-1]|uniref:Stk1 family PASTA domain-containing Ser/Thr kinase n=1 Tax=unclassified Cryobacterium TaxID=2649013 RepID=UPI00106A8782|nr:MULTISPECIES: Stk1 family PASTA domain-containing Ser/Thr kinase [unclassified Cryobacterium]TFB55433.1 Stk1 family PASTA domain-containing Ser/Thr kinase [Cryobacterium sp. Sr3]TFC52985.1 Stk1 family PASTA domain-containing Ser/Thr kinase [Cryobacterium sp. TMT2-17-1]TFC64102.1 Stk1 family PASTA domain-containing Ser/Thr kinase [Cryobacterium sp. TMT2-4]